MSKLPKGMVKKGHRYYFRIRETKEGKKTERTIPLGDDFQLARVQHARLTRRQEDWRGQPTVAEFSKRWISDYVTPMRSGKGPKLAEQRMRDYILPVLGTKVLGEVTEADLMTVRAQLEKTELSPMSIRHILSDAGCLFRFAVAAGLITRSPFTTRALPRIQEEIPDPLTDEELAAAIEACPPQHLALVRLALWTGLRYSELRGLRWENVHLEGAEPYAMIVRSGHAKVTKSRRARRIPLGQETVSLLRFLPRESSWVFTGRFGETIAQDPSGAVLAIKRRVAGFHFHRLRHTFACRCLRAGMPLAVLQKLLGHSTVRMTERYARLFDPDVAREFRALPANWMPGIDGGEGLGKERGSRVG